MSVVPCGLVGCGEDAIFAIDTDIYNDVRVDACESHVGELLGWPMDGSPPAFWRVWLIESEDCFA